MTATALVTGATGTIGAALVPALLRAGWTVRVLTRRRDALDPSWAAQVQVVQGDASDAEVRRRALAGVEVVYFLLHSMAAAGDFAARDRGLARGFAASAREAGTRRIVYLSGLHPAGPLSAHLASRVEVGEILLASGVPTAVLQAGVVLGEGSASFEMLRHLTERLPAMLGPRWLGNRIQPIALPDVVHYLVRAADLPPDVNRTIDLGMDEVLTYSEMMRRYARVAGLLPRFVATVPVLTPWLASHWVGLVTPVRAAIAKPLVGSLIHDAVRSEQDAARILGDPPGGTVGFDDAVRAALAGRDPHRWARTVAGVGVAVAGCAVLGSLATAPDTRWYRRLRKPVWQPPAAAFPLVWSALYATVALASAATIADLEEQGDPRAARGFRGALGLNLVLNAGWCAVFFRGHRLVPATVWAAALAASSLDLVRRARPAGTGKAVGLSAYAAWTSFATVLTGTVAALNRRTDQGGDA